MTAVGRGRDLICEEDGHGLRVAEDAPPGIAKVTPEIGARTSDTVRGPAYAEGNIRGSIAEYADPVTPSGKSHPCLRPEQVLQLVQWARRCRRRRSHSERRPRVSEDRDPDTDLLREAESPEVENGLETTESVDRAWDPSSGLIQRVHRMARRLLTLLRAAHQCDFTRPSERIPGSRQGIGTEQARPDTSSSLRTGCTRGPRVAVVLTVLIPTRPDPASTPVDARPGFSLRCQPDGRARHSHHAGRVTCEDGRTCSGPGRPGIRRPRRELRDPSQSRTPPSPG